MPGGPDGPALEGVFSTIMDPKNPSWYMEEDSRSFAITTRVHFNLVTN